MVCQARRGGGSRAWGSNEGRPGAAPGANTALAGYKSVARTGASTPTTATDIAAQNWAQLLSALWSQQGSGAGLVVAEADIDMPIAGSQGALADAAAIGATPKAKVNRQARKIRNTTPP